MSVKNYQSIERIREKLENVDFGEDIKGIYVQEIDIERDYSRCPRWVSVDVNFILIEEEE